MLIRPCSSTSQRLDLQVAELRLADLALVMGGDRQADEELRRQRLLKLVRVAGPLEISAAIHRVVRDNGIAATGKPEIDRQPVSRRRHQPVTITGSGGGRAPLPGVALSRGDDEIRVSSTWLQRLADHQARL